MKRNLILIFIILCGVAFSDGWAKRPKKNQTTQELTVAERVSRKALREKNIAERLDSLKRELERQKQEDKEWMMNIPYRTGPAPAPLPIVPPCAEEAVSTDDYYAAFMEGRGGTAQEAMRCALVGAIRDIQSRGVSNISYIQVVCQQILQEPNGEYECYMAIHVPKKNESDSLKVDDQILMWDSVQRDSLRQVFKERFDSLLNAQKMQLQNNIKE